MEPPSASPSADAPPSLAGTPDTASSSFTHLAADRAYWQLAPSVVILLDREGVITEANPAARRQLACTSLEGQAFSHYLVAESHAPFRQRLQSVMEAKEQSSLAGVCRRPDDSTFQAELHLAWWPLSCASRPLAVLSLVEGHDSSEKETSLRASLDRYRSFMEHFQGIAYQIPRSTWKPIFLAGTVEALTGYPPEEFLQGRVHWDQIIHPEDLPRVRGELDKLHAIPGYTSSAIYRIRHQNGSIRWVNDVAQVATLSPGSPPILQGAMHDITRQHRIEEDLRASEARYRKLFEKDLTGDYLATVDGTILDCNDAFVRIFGFHSKADALRSNLLCIYPDPAVRLTELELLQTQKELTYYEADLRRRDGKPVHVVENLVGCFNSDGKLGQIMGYVFDDTQRKHLEDRLRQSQKMEAIGQLAGGVAHDFNNLLTVINGYSEILLSQMSADDPQREFLRQIHGCGERATALARQLLVFSRRQVLSPVILSMNEVIRELEKMLRRLIGEDIELLIRVDPAVGRIKADGGQIEQLLMNLVVNARDAMPTGGKLWIETRKVVLDRSSAQLQPHLNPGPHVRLRVTDTGEGMSPEVKARLFEPFFTTKEPGRGTGLGLATVYGVVKQSKGHIEVESQVGRGTTFTIWLPLISSEERKASPETSEFKMPLGHETILLAEDEAGVRSLARLTLESNGYRVLEAHSGMEALLVAERHGGPVHLLVTDVVMPKMSGRQLADRLKVDRPEIKVLYLSGYTDDAVLRHGVVQGTESLLQKPFSPATLARKVREVLDK